MLGVLNLVKENISRSLDGIKRLVYGKNRFDIDQLYNRIVKGHIQNVLRVHTLIDQIVYHLIHDRCLADTPCTGQHSETPKCLVLNHFQRFVVGKPFLRLAFLFDCQGIAPPRIILSQNLDNLLIAYDCHKSTSRFLLFQWRYTFILALLFWSYASIL